jgi:hypothetical protein
MQIHILPDWKGDNPMRRITALIVLSLLVASLIPLTPASLAGPQDAAIKLKAATFRPGLGEQPDIPPGLTIAEPPAGVAGYYLVQFAGPIQSQWKGALETLGADILAYIPDFAYKVRMTPGIAGQVRRLGQVAWVGVFHPAYKISPALNRGGTRLYTVRVEQGAEAGQVRAAIASSGAQVLTGQGKLIRVAADEAQIEAIARVLDVAWIENLVLREKHNEYGAGVILGANAANALGYDGSTQIVAVADTGLGGGTAATAHPDIPASRITAIFNWEAASDPSCYSIIGDGAKDVDSGHGTHTAASVLSDGANSGEGKGTAPAASLVFQAVEDYADMVSICSLYYEDGYYLLGLPADLRDLYEQAYNAGARIHSNSWGSDAAGDYTEDSASTDDFVWTNPDMTITFSAGNAGIDSNGDGYVDLDSMGSPATAKNTITVGASENDRQGNWDCDTGLSYTSCAAQGGQNNLFTYGAAWPSDFPANPVASDVSAGNAEQLAAFSSRGPTDDGRIKPDVVAPGTWVLSGYSDLYQQGYDASPNPQNGVWQYDGWGFPLSNQYKYMGGTSMSNPLTAGGAAVVRDFYQKAHSHSASAALVKATLINSAVDLLDENNDGADDNDFPIPNNHEGWGRIDLAAATDGSHQFVDEAGGLGTGGSASYQFSVASPGQPFKVSLVWSDYPSTEAAVQNLVNDLDLVVTAPGGSQYRGNVFSGGWSQTGGSADRTNNVENVYVQSAQTGAWTVQVSGYNVPNGPQPYAFVIDGAFGVVDTPPDVSIDSPANDSTVIGSVSVLISASDAEDAEGALTVEWNVDGGAWQPAIHSSGTTYEASWDSTTVGDGPHTLNARAIDSASNVGTDSNDVIVDNVPDVQTVYVDSIVMSVVPDGRAFNHAEAVVTIVDQNGAPFGGATVTGSFSGDSADGGLSQTTDGSGQATFLSSSVKKGKNWTFCVDNVSAAGYDYIPSENVETCDSTGTTEPTPTPTPTPGPGTGSIHIGDLDGTGTPVRTKWQATVTILVHDQDEAEVANAVVTGTWSGGATGIAECTTDANGTCEVVKNNLKDSVSSVTFAVDSVALSGYTYSASANHDPDGSSNGTTITVSRPW